MFSVLNLNYEIIFISYIPLDCTLICLLKTVTCNTSLISKTIFPSS